jgi:Flp pilus assembly protein TadD
MKAGLTAYRHALASAIAVLGMQVPVLALPPANRDWIELRTPHYTVYSEVPESEARAIAGELEIFRSTVAKAAPYLQPKESKPTIVFAFRDEVSFALYRKSSGLASPQYAGFFMSGSDTDFIGVKAALAGVQYTIVYHESIHAFQSQNFPPLPVWLREGQAEYLSNFRVDGATARIGGAQDRLLLGVLRKNPPLPLKQVFGERNVGRYHEEDAVNNFYATSWLLVHYLMHAQGERRARFDSYLEALRKGERQAKADGDAFGFEYASLEEELRAYLKRDSYPPTLVPVDRVPDEGSTSVRSVSRQQALLQLGNLLTHGDAKLYAEAEAHLAEAARLAPDDASNKAALGFLRDRQGRFNDAVSLFDTAVELGVADAVTLFRAAEAHMHRTPLGRGRATDPGPAVATSEDPDVLRAQDLLRRGLKQDPDNAAALANLGLTHVITSSDPQEGIDALRKAWERMPSRIDVGQNLFVLLLQKGDREGAVDVLEHRLGNSLEHDGLAAAREQLLRFDLRHGKDMADKDRGDEAIDRVRKGMETLEDPHERERVQIQLSRLEAYVTRRREIAAYNAAIDLNDKNNVRGATKALEALVATCKDPEVCQNAKDALAMIKH